VNEDVERMRRLNMDNFYEWSVDLKSNLLMREAWEAVVSYDD